MATKRQSMTHKHSSLRKGKSKPTSPSKVGSRTGTKKQLSGATTTTLLKADFAPKFFALPGVESEDFNGVLTLADNQASLSGTLLLFGDVADVAAAIHAAADVLDRQGFHTGQPIVITGSKAVIHFNDHPLAVIVMTNARVVG